MTESILVINPGSTSTKVAYFENEKIMKEKTISHSVKEIDKFKSISDQLDFRTKIIQRFLSDTGIAITELDAIVGRGGLLKPIPGGTYRVNDKMKKDLSAEHFGSHASNLGGLIASSLGELAGAPAFIVDPVVVDELSDIARVSGLKGIVRRSVFHALNQKAVSRKILSEIGKSYEEGRVIVAHIGGGVSVGAHSRGEVIDVTNGLDGEGPFSPERTGTLPLVEFIKYINVNELNDSQIQRTIAGNGGVKSYLNETDLIIVENRIDAGDEEAKLIYDSMLYQISKAIGEMAVVLSGDVDAIILTGGAAHSKYIVDSISKMTQWIADVHVVAGELEMEALAAGAQRVLNGESDALTY